LKHLRSLPKGFERSRWGEAIIEAVTRGLERDPKTLPRPARVQAAANGGAVVELLKVLLRMISESHHVAAKVLATVDDLERIAADDTADVPALSGWRRDLFGEKALALILGQLALAIEDGRGTVAERGYVRGIKTRDFVPVLCKTALRNKTMRLHDCHNFHDFRALARRRLPGPIFNYIDGGADDEATLRRNTASFERCDLVPNI